MIFESFPLLSVMLPYFHYADKTYELMRSLSKKTQSLLDENVAALIRYCVKRELELHLIKTMDSGNSMSLMRTVHRFFFGEAID